MGWLAELIAFGDSHVHCAVAGGAEDRYVGAVTLHRLGRRGEAVTLLGEPGDVLVIVGEIDVRGHIARQVEHRVEEDVIWALALGAEHALHDLERAGSRVRMCAVIPPTPEGNVIEMPVPFRGTIRQRARWCIMLNDALRAVVEVVDPYAPFRTQSGTLREGCSTDGVHLADEYGQEAFGWLV